jgi:hypothetical protein
MFMRSSLRACPHRRLSPRRWRRHLDDDEREDFLAYGGDANDGATQQTTATAHRTGQDGPAR